MRVMSLGQGYEKERKKERKRRKQEMGFDTLLYTMAKAKRATILLLEPVQQQRPQSRREP